MAGQMGHERVTIKNLEIALVDTELNVIGIKGAVPGPRGNLIMIYGGGDIQLVTLPNSQTESKEETVAAVVEDKKEPAVPVENENKEDKTESTVEEKQETTIS